jgi:replicative DNA helicase
MKTKGQLPPHSKDLEKAILGAIIVENGSITNVLEIIKTPEVFYVPAHQEIFKAMLELYNASDAIDFLTVVQQLNKHAVLGPSGGPGYIVELSQGIYSSGNIATHCRKILEAYVKRQIIATAHQLLESSYTPVVDAIDLLTKAQGDIINLNEMVFQKQEQTMLQVVGECINDIHHKRTLKDITGMASPCTSINRVTAGWQNSDLIIGAGRPAMGKTAFVLNEIRHIGVNLKKPIGIFSLEMAAKQLVNRLICSETLIDSNSIRRPGRLSDDELIRINRDTARLASSPIYIDDTAGISIMQLKAKATKWKAKYGIEFLVVDYLQLIKDPTKKNREQEIGSITRQLKELAKELNIPVIALSQLSREVEKRNPKRPMLSDLRESGSIEQDADLVFFLYRPEYYGVTQDEMGNSVKGIVEVIIAKHRNGATEDIYVEADLATNRFADVGELNKVEPEPTYNINKMPVSEFESEEAPF